MPVILNLFKNIELPLILWPLINFLTSVIEKSEKNNNNIILNYLENNENIL